MLVAEALRSFFIRMDFVRDKKIPICRAVDKQRADGKQTVSPQNLSHKKQRKKALKIAFQSQNGRGDRIRTCDPLVPNQVR